MGSSSCFGLLADGPAAGNREQNTLHGIYTHAHTIQIYKILHVSTTFPSTNHRHIKTCIRDCQLQGGRTLVRCFFHKLIEGLFFRIHCCNKNSSGLCTKAEKEEEIMHFVCSFVLDIYTNTNYTHQLLLHGPTPLLQ